MKKLILSLAVVLASVGLLGSKAGAAPLVPAACTASYAHTYVLPTGSYFIGDNSNELIYVTGDGVYIESNGGSDCVVISGSGTYVSTGAGADVVVTKDGIGNYVDGGAGNDNLSVTASSYIEGGFGVDKCVITDYVTSYKQNCEL